MVVERARFYDINTPCLDNSRVVYEEGACTTTSDVRQGPTTVHWWYLSGGRYLKGGADTATRQVDGSYAMRDYQPGGTWIWFNRVGDNLEVTHKVHGNVQKFIQHRAYD